MSVQVVRGEIDSKDATARLVLPTAVRMQWPPFERVAETIATPRRPFPPHRHERAEVLTYIIEGSATYSFGAGPPEPIGPGSTRLLTAPSSVSHAINPIKGQTVRWFALVVTLPPAPATSIRLQSSQTTKSEMQPEGIIQRELVGPRSRVNSAAGLESELVEFLQEGTVFRKVGHDRAAIIYALSGHGSVDNYALDAGEAAFVDDAAGVALGGGPGFQVILSSAPRRLGV